MSKTFLKEMRRLKHTQHSERFSPNDYWLVDMGEDEDEEGDEPCYLESSSGTLDECLNCVSNYISIEVDMALRLSKRSVTPAQWAKLLRSAGWAEIFTA